VDNTDLPLNRKTTAEIEDHLDRVENLLDESLGLDDEARSDLMETRHYLSKELKRREAVGPPVVKPRPVVSAKPKPIPCAHTRCGSARTTIDCFDDHGGNAGVYYVRDYCSLNCFVCDLKHVFDEMRYGGLDKIREILGRIGA
jgi:hypothetical protein